MVRSTLWSTLSFSPSSCYFLQIFLIFISSHAPAIVILPSFKRPYLTLITVFPFYFPNNFKQLEYWYYYTHDWVLMSGDRLQHIRSLESRLKDKLCSSRSKIFPPIKRGASLDVYLTTSGNGVIANPKLACDHGLVALVCVLSKVVHRHLSYVATRFEEILWQWYLLAYALRQQWIKRKSLNIFPAIWNITINCSYDFVPFPIVMTRDIICF